MKVRFQDTNEIVTVENAADLVDWMRSGSFTRDLTNRSYMLGYAQRAVLASNQDIRATSEEEFVEDLEKLNHIRIER